MDLYLLYLFIAAITISSPGPGVILTLTNTVRYGFSGALSGILGIVSSMFIIAIISATSLGLLLSTSALAFSIIKYTGAAYLIYLGIKLWRTPQQNIQTYHTQINSHLKRFIEGFSITFFNPKPIFFFISLFPQFIDPTGNYISQFIILAISFSLLAIVIHCLYALGARSAQAWLTSKKGHRTVNKLGGGAFIAFGAGLATSNK